MVEQAGTLQKPKVVVGQQHAPRAWMWLFGLTIAGLTLTGFCLGILAVIASEGELNPFTHLFFLPFVTVVYGIVGFLVTVRHPHNAQSWILCLVGFFSALTLLTSAYTQFERFALTQTGAGLSDFFAWLDKWVWVIPSIVPLTYVLLLFPNGRLPSPRWRWLSWVIGVGTGAIMIGAALHPGPLSEFGLSGQNPYGIAGAEDLLEPLLYLAGLFMMLGVLGSFASVAVRYRRATGIERTQLKWMVYTIPSPKIRR